MDKVREALEKIVNAKMLARIRPLVAGWNGEDLPLEKRYAPHHDELGVKLLTCAGEVYELDKALMEARAALSSLRSPESAAGEEMDRIGTSTRS